MKLRVELGNSMIEPLLEVSASSHSHIDARSGRHRFAGVRIELPSDWADISADLPLGASPTLAKLLGNGALQFRVWQYFPQLAGAFEALDAKSAVFAFAEKFGLGTPSEIESGSAVQNFAIATYQHGNDIIRVWCFTGGRNVALLTYVGYIPSPTSSEFSEAHSIAMSLTFDN
ncbi:hypothetical protein [Variovorax guangxiensis]|uniref:hypothetical protein n=1 Tax=Variovorax guangxiensis TaxID=1775474 RepID=UPI001126C24E|nr:hypothetical protein [Variovorax guangxiensis]